ncbi:type IV secretory system conjugative DNA transfer family protein [Fibrella sp. HMF5405]|uniref:Type IV secretory system conjugative DNA transfer family protein n=1 Tax=Fibrella forsythiae TaxID=2817061 RepID=A0ABS3JKS0_9BACT|nr:type IV secretory system conjugative DNA transfer family protein [Fibrella forsythiae]
MLIEGNKFGSARFARPKELNAYRTGPGLYIGGEFVFKDKGHKLTVAGTRGGKGTNLIIPNLLGLGGCQGSWVVIDPKGENAAITVRYQRESGQNVVILNP